jgi:hypothetical protein
MSELYAMFTDASMTVIGAVSLGPQDPDAYPYQDLISQHDQRYVAYLNLMLPTPEETANKKRDELLGLAAIRVAPLQDAVDLGDSTAEEGVMLKKWKQYRVELNRLPSTGGWPNAVTWPAEPDL